MENKTEERSWDDVLRSMYESTAYWDIQWIDKAENLIACARLLEPAIEQLFATYRQHSANRAVPLVPDHYTKSYLMLMGFAFENLFKAVIVRRDGRGSPDKTKMLAKVKDHDLPRLAKDAGFPLDREREDLLRRMTRCAVWEGRYPVPTSWDKGRNTEIFSDGQSFLVAFFAGNDPERIDKLLNELRDELGIRRRFKT
jgi:hypothetical protein